MNTRERGILPKNLNLATFYKIYILDQLSKGNKVYGNKILENLKIKLNDSPFPVNSSTVYDSLYFLEEKGYVKSYWSGDEFLNKRNKKIYQISDEGLSFLKINIVGYVEQLNKTKNTINILLDLIS